MAELSSSDQDWVACKNWNIYYLVFSIKSLLIPVLEEENKRGREREISWKKPISDTEAEQYQEIKISPRYQGYGMTHCPSILMSESNTSLTQLLMSQIEEKRGGSQTMQGKVKSQKIY